jgi:hypothetical protein
MLVERLENVVEHVAWQHKGAAYLSERTQRIDECYELMRAAARHLSRYKPKRNKVAVKRIVKELRRIAGQSKFGV